MKKGWFIAIIIFTGFIFSGSVYSEEQKNVNTGNTVDSGYEAFKVKAKQEELYKKALSLKEDGNYDAAQGILKKLVTDNPGIDKYEISYVDVILDQSLAMKEAKNNEWKIKAKEAGYTIKRLYKANMANSDYWGIYAKYSWLVEANAHCRKALQKAFYYKANNPDAFIVQADYNFDMALEASDVKNPNSTTLGMDTETDRVSLAKSARSSYESALLGNLSDARKAYIYYKMGNLENQIFHKNDIAKKNWETAVKLSPDSKSGKLAKLRLGI